MIINIEDVNDNAPMFLANKYEARLLENEMEFENPLVLEARDLDLNGEFLIAITFLIVYYYGEMNKSPNNFEYSISLLLIGIILLFDTLLGLKVIQ